MSATCEVDHAVSAVKAMFEGKGLLYKSPQAEALVGLALLSNVPTPV